MKARNLILITIILLFLFSTPLLAQQYKLNVGDKINISVWGHQDLSREAVIDPNGEISYPLVGKIEAEGKSTSEIRAELKSSLSEYIINPEVNVNLVSYRSLSASIQGEVKNPGRYELNNRKDTRLNEILAQAGSITEDAGEKVRLISAGKPIEFKLKDTLAAKNEANPIINDGDSIYIPSALEEVTILGEISRPGSYEWNEDMRLANLIARAGNTNDRANLENIRLVHANSEIKEIDMQDFFENDDLTANPKLEPGDLIMVGEKDSVDWTRVFFLFSGFNEIKNFFDVSW